MATCLIEQSAPSNNEVSILDLWKSLNQMAAKQPPVSPSTSLTSGFGNVSTTPKRCISSSWTDEDRAGARALYDIMNNSSRSAPASLTKNKNDPADILLHQLSELCTSAQGVAVDGNKVSPFLFEADTGSSTLKSTHLANDLISCFVVGGEIRLCSPQVYGVILKDVVEPELSHLIREYRIVDQTASHEQYTSLKANHALPAASNTCGLMTKSNAERLVGALIDPVNYRRLPDEKRMKLEPILVQHDCFGGCEARLFTALYPGPCIECTTCNCLMIPESFSRHSHTESREHSQVCHWGFDAVNWRNYLRLHDSLENDIDYHHRFARFIQIESKGRESTLEDDLEAATSKKGNPMFNVSIPALAASLLQAHQNNVATSAGPSTSGTPTAPGISAQNQLLALILANANINNPVSTPGTSPAISQQPSFLSQLQASQNITSSSNLPLSLNQNLSFLALQQQQQHLSALRNAMQAPTPLSSNDDCDIPRKRAHTLADPSSCRAAAAAATVNKESPPVNNASFGALPTDQQLITLLSQLTTHDNVIKITEMVSNTITQRTQPVIDENSRLRKEVETLRRELKEKQDLVAKLALGQQRLNLVPRSTHTSVMELDEEQIDVDA